MAIFTVRSDTITLIVRAKCISCARQAAVEFSEEEGTLVWRDQDKSKVELLTGSGYKENGPRAVLKRSKHG